MDLTRDAILAADDRSDLLAVEVPEWGGTVYIRLMGSDERDAYELKYAQVPKEQLVGMRAYILALTLSDAQGNPLFTRADIKALGQKSALVTDRLFEIASTHNGLNDAALDDAKKNSSDAVSTDSGMSSPSASADAPSANGNRSWTVASSPSGLLSTS